MKKLFICLANSKKYTQRCVAGIELARSSRRGYKYEIVKRNDNPVWVRPVSGSEHGEIAPQLVDHFNLLDIVKIDAIAPFPKGYQSENVLFDNRRLEVVDEINKHHLLIDKLLAIDEPTLFGNRDRAVHIDEIGQLDYSLILIKPTNVQVYERASSGGSPKIRAAFTYNDVPYDLPITDIDFVEKFSLNPDILETCTHVYFTISLGIAFEGRHYKLIAGVLYF